jgi:hypothetical protein
MVNEGCPRPSAVMEKEIGSTSLRLLWLRLIFSSQWLVRVVTFDVGFVAAEKTHRALTGPTVAVKGEDLNGCDSDYVRIGLHVLNSTIGGSDKSHDVSVDSRTTRTVHGSNLDRDCIKTRLVSIACEFHPPLVL